MNPQEQLDTLKDIRNIMHRSSRFISLSGLSGVFAGVTALVGAYFANQSVNTYKLANITETYTTSGLWLEGRLMLIAVVVLVVALLGGVFFTYRQSKRKQLPIWDATTKNLLINLFIPLATGGVFILALLANYRGALMLVAPSTLIFYGLALINASKYTYSDIRFLGICEVTLGTIALFYPGFGLYFWTIGFGILHILYGAIMFFKYEQDTKTN
jgi:hypothetical protein